MAETKAHNLAQVKAAKLLKKRTGSVSSGLSAGTEHQPRKHRGYAPSVSTVSYMDHPHDDDFFMKPATQYENTYQMEPKVRFPVGAIEKMMYDVLAGYLCDEAYDPDFCRKMTKTISDDVKARVKEMSIPRYKIICLIHIGEANGQGLRIGSRCLWNSKFDTFSSCEYKNNSLFAVASVYDVDGKYQHATVSK